MFHQPYPCPRHVLKWSAGDEVQPFKNNGGSSKRSLLRLCQVTGHWLLMSLNICYCIGGKNPQNLIGLSNQLLWLLLSFNNTELSFKSAHFKTYPLKQCIVHEVIPEHSPQYSILHTYGLWSRHSKISRFEVLWAGLERTDLWAALAEFPLPGCKWRMLSSESTEVAKMKNLNISYFNFVTPHNHLDLLYLKFKTVRQSTNYKE